MRARGGGCGGRRCTVAHHVEILRDDHEVHDRLGVNVLHLVLEGVDTLAQPLHDGLVKARARARVRVRVRVRVRD